MDARDIKPIADGPRMTTGEALAFLENKMGFHALESHQFLHEQEPANRKLIFQRVMDRKKGLEYA